MSISSTGLYGSATIVNSDLFTDVETLKETVTTLNTTYLQTTAEHRTDISQNRFDISQNKADISENRFDISQNKADISENRFDISQNKARDAMRGRCTGCDARTSTDWLHLRDAVRGLGFRV